MVNRKNAYRAEYFQPDLFDQEGAFIQKWGMAIAEKIAGYSTTAITERPKGRNCRIISVIVVQTDFYGTGDRYEIQVSAHSNLLGGIPDGWDDSEEKFK